MIGWLLLTRKKRHLAQAEMLMQEQVLQAGNKSRLLAMHNADPRL
jgi:hypothetical protein